MAEPEEEAQTAIFRAITVKAELHALNTAEDILQLAQAYALTVGDDSSATPEREPDPYCTGATQMLEYDPQGLDVDRVRVVGFSRATPAHVQK